MVTKTVVTTLLTLFFPFSFGMRELFPEILRNCPINECVQSNCPHFKRRLEEYKQTRNNDALNELKDLICNEEEKALCCKKQEKITARTTTPRPSLEPSCGKSQRIPESVNKHKKDILKDAGQGQRLQLRLNFDSS